MGTLYVLEAANLFCGSADPSQSKHLKLEQVKIPGHVEKMSDFHGAGAPVAIEIPVGIEAFKLEFKMLGTDEQTMRLFGLSSPYRHDYTVYGALRDHQTGREHELKAVVTGRLAKVEHGEFKKGDLHMTDYEIGALMSYRLHVSGQEELYWNYGTNTLRIGGVDVHGPINRILRIPQQQN